MAKVKRDVAVHQDTGQKYCVTGDDDGCIDTTFVVPESLHPFYDPGLAEATVELQKILDKVRQKNNDPRRGLVFINTSKGLLLAWVLPLVTRRDGDDALLSALGILNFEPLKDSGLKQREDEMGQA